jgi:hypothetical protein
MKIGYAREGKVKNLGYMGKRKWLKRETGFPDILDFSTTFAGSLCSMFCTFWLASDDANLWDNSLKATYHRSAPVTRLWSESVGNHGEAKR